MLSRFLSFFLFTYDWVVMTSSSSSTSFSSSSHESSYSVTVTNTPAIKNAPLIGLAEGNGYFENYQLIALVLGIPWVLKRSLPLFNLGGWKTYWFLVILLGIPIVIAYWSAVSHYGPRKNQKVRLPGRSIEEYITIHDPELKAKYFAKQKIPMQVFHDAFFEGKIDFKGESYDSLPTAFFILFTRLLRVSGDILDIMEQRHDWAKMSFTPELFKYVFTQFIPEVIMHTKSQDEEQVRGHYDSMYFTSYSWPLFLAIQNTVDLHFFRR